jgi:dolichol kinase
LSVVFLSDNTEELELKRKLVHLLNGCAIAAAVYFLKPVFGVLILAPLAAALLLLHITPRIKPDLWVMNHLLYHFERRKDIPMFPFKGAILFGYGIAFPILFLPSPYDAAVIVILSVGDCFSNLVGRRYGRMRIGGRSLEGAIGFLIPAWAASAILIDTYHGLVLSSAGAIIELLSPWDDNVAIPLILTVIVRFLLP